MDYYIYVTFSYAIFKFYQKHFKIILDLKSACTTARTKLYVNIFLLFYVTFMYFGEFRIQGIRHFLGILVVLINIRYVTDV